MNQDFKNRYVHGLLFSEDFHFVALLHKDKGRGPEKVRGLIQGVGGRVQVGESSRGAMAREFQEEANAITDPNQWTCFHTSRFINGSQCDHMVAVGTAAQMASVKTTGGEPVTLWRTSTATMHSIYVFDESIGDFSNSRCSMPMNVELSFLIPMAVHHIKSGPGFRNLGH